MMVILLLLLFFFLFGNFHLFQHQAYGLTQLKFDISYLKIEKMRKFLLLIFAACGSLTGTFFIFVESKSPVWPIVGVLSLVSNVSLGASTVLSLIHI